VGQSGQSVLDIGTGTGVLARALAARGCQVSATDLSDGQIAQGCSLAEDAGLTVDFRVAPANADVFEADSFDAVTALQCWWYFDHAVTLHQIRKVLRPSGKLAICGFSFLPREDPIVAASEGLVLKYNSAWSGADWDGATPVMAHTMPGEGWVKVGSFVFDADIPFTAEGWRGRMRALRGIGAALSPETVREFDAEHAVMLTDLAGKAFTITHRIDAQIYQPES
jgi:SAM-dependent methyltransferase